MISAMTDLLVLLLLIQPHKAERASHEARPNYVRDCRLSNNLKADGITDDSVALNRCLVAAVSNGQGVVQLPCGQIKVNSAINDTNKPSLTIQGCGANQDYGTNTGGNNYGTNQTQILCNTGTVCWDATGSGTTTLRNFSIRIKSTEPTPSTIGILFGRDNAVSGSGWKTGAGTYCFDEFVVLNNLYVYADSRPAATHVGSVAIYNVGAEQFTILGGKYIADVPFFASERNDLTVLSPYQKLAQGCPVSLSEIAIKQGATFQSWTGSAFNIRSTLDVQFEKTTEILNGLPGKNHSGAITMIVGPYTNILLQGQSEGYDFIGTFAGQIDHLTLAFTAVSPTSGLITLSQGASVSNSTFALAQRNGKPQPLFNATTGMSTIKGSNLTEGTLSGSGPGAANITLMGSIVQAPGLTDNLVNTFAAGSCYDLFDDSGRSFPGCVLHISSTSVKSPD